MFAWATAATKTVLAKIKEKKSRGNSPKGRVFFRFSFPPFFLLCDQLSCKTDIWGFQQHLLLCWGGAEQGGDRQQERVSGGMKLHKYYIKQSEHHAKKICINNLYRLATIYLAYFFLLSSAQQDLSVFLSVCIQHVCLYGLIRSKCTRLHRTACVLGFVCSRLCPFQCQRLNVSCCTAIHLCTRNKSRR